MNIKLSEIEIKNLKVFLSRVDLKGSEVFEFARILQAVNEATSDEKAGDIDG